MRSSKVCVSLHESSRRNDGFQGSRCGWFFSIVVLFIRHSAIGDPLSEFSEVVIYGGSKRLWNMAAMGKPIACCPLQQSRGACACGSLQEHLLSVERTWNRPAASAKTNRVQHTARPWFVETVGLGGAGCASCAGCAAAGSASADSCASCRGAWPRSGHQGGQEVGARGTHACALPVLDHASASENRGVYEVALVVVRSRTNLHRYFHNCVWAQILRSRKDVHLVGPWRGSTPMQNKFVFF